MPAIVMPSMSMRGSPSITMRSAKVPRVAFIGIAADVFLFGLGIVHRLPLDAGGEARTAAAAKAGLGDFGDDGGAGKAKRLLQTLEAAMRHIVGNRNRIGDAAARKGQAFLILEVGMVFDIAEAQRMRAAGEEACC